MFNYLSIGFYVIIKGLTKEVINNDERNYATQLLTIVKKSTKAISYEDAAKKLKATNPQLQDTTKNTMGIKNILEKICKNMAK
ncbi:hypothetical protein KHA80_00310 [Anaerobacillus sp. HL2]|nr:hypothetical protein KHA80_00310 [Anaerobacillus sp. HL2]